MYAEVRKIMAERFWEWFSPVELTLIDEENDNEAT